MRTTHIGLGVFVLMAMGCASQPAMDSQAASELEATVPEDVSADVARIRAATAPFKSLDAAVAAGYAAHVARCIDNPPHGAMGYHHQNDALLDDQLDIERPEMLVYERLPSGDYRLNGVEYIVPFSHRPASAEPPVIMGQKLKPAPALNLWYLHVWAFTENPSGVFADWNPLVECQR